MESIWVLRGSGGGSMYGFFSNEASAGEERKKMLLAIHDVAGDMTTGAREFPVVEEIILDQPLQRAWFEVHIEVNRGEGLVMARSVHFPRAGEKPVDMGRLRQDSENQARRPGRDTYIGYGWSYVEAKEEGVRLFRLAQGGPERERNFWNPQPGRIRQVPVEPPWFPPPNDEDLDDAGPILAANV